GFCGPRSLIVPRVAMFTTAGDTFLTIGDKEGTGVSPTVAGMAAGAGGAITASVRMAARAKSARFMVIPVRTMPGEIPQAASILQRSRTGDAVRSNAFPWDATARAMTVLPSCAKNKGPTHSARTG